ncbi:MAG: Ig-like domain-containing protein [Candidatus Zixiibacteriota bacterium]|jgi:hypothetical protein
MFRYILIVGALVAAAAGPAVPLEVGDDHPALANYTINNVAPSYHGPWLDVNSYSGKGVVVVHWKASSGQSVNELGQLESLYDAYHNEGAGVEVISYNGWDDAYTQYQYKYIYFAHVLPQDFLDAEAGDFYAWRMPGSEWDSQTSVVGTTGKIYWMEADSFTEAEIVNALRRTINGDTAAPYCLNATPAPGATGVNVNTDIAVNLMDDGSGVDRDSVRVSVTVPGDAVVPGDLSFSGNFLDFRLTFDPTSQLPGGTVVTVKVDGKDLFDNAMPTYEWSFTTTDTHVEPTSLGKVKGLFH